ncbi:MAG: cytochrome c1 [Dokdonella sp.]
MIDSFMNSARRSLTGLLIGTLVSFAPAALASEGGGLMAANVSLNNTGSLQNGAKLYFNYCSGCHALRFMRYARIAEDLGLSEEQVTKNFMFNDAKFGETIHANINPKDAAEWFGKAPPDLSLEVRARGADWVYTYLKSFYLDPSRPLGWNNTLFPNASMPNPLWELQGLQTATFKPGHEGADHDFEKFELRHPGSESAAEFDETVRDLTAFLQYASEPAALHRKSIGIWVLLYLGVFTFLAWLMKNEYWKDVH